mmetsp:Transcript_106184/g.331236  ORF Transcript_106184/g.331236 Transcript_106184/m.331236 type:complete len:396 (+) Transcript_106184:37-1224(+)
MVATANVIRTNKGWQFRHASLVRDGLLVVRVAAGAVVGSPSAARPAASCPSAATKHRSSRPAVVLVAVGELQAGLVPALLRLLAPARGARRGCAGRPWRRGGLGPRGPWVHRGAWRGQLLFPAAVGTGRRRRRLLGLLPARAPEAGSLGPGLLLLLLLLGVSLLLLLGVHQGGLRQGGRSRVVGASRRDLRRSHASRRHAASGLLRYGHRLLDQAAVRGRCSRVVEDPIDGPSAARAVRGVVAGPGVELQYVTVGERQLLAPSGLQPLARSTQPEQVAAQGDHVEASAHRVPLDAEVLAAHVLRDVVGQGLQELLPLVQAAHGHADRPARDLPRAGRAARPHRRAAELQPESGSLRLVLSLRCLLLRRLLLRRLLRCQLLCSLLLCQSLRILWWQ